ncbi:MAG: DUF4215 domain-containing protein, partial [Deltaproteobacteria bacterium]|nr:DUF4215 domain-containing protein [Deltaproteobacteria bacterium]
CQNTGRLPDVVYHEFGHALHAASIVEGVGSFDGALSEGISDYLAASITGDSGMGRGFFYGNDPLRELDPEGTENRWPEDIGGVHTTGLIFAGAMWDLRNTFITKYGTEDGIALADRLFYGAVQTATDIPSSYISVITEDDDDGDLSNGTPNICDINQAFGLHGLRSLTAEIAGLAAELPSSEGHPVTMTLSGLYDICPGDDVTSATLIHNPQGRPEEAKTINLEDLGERTFAGVVPTPGEPQVVEYQVRVEFADGSSRTFPENIADPRYQFYVGETIELYCTTFDEADPFDNGWEHGLADGEDTEGADDWQWGIPAGVSGSGDPVGAFSGESVIGNDLGGADFNGKYQANKTNFALSPVIDVQRYSDVRLQYRRWLSVEDAFFDQASIYVDEFLAWQNFDSDSGNNSKTHHRDLEWRFHDVSLSPFIAESEFRLKFEIKSDAGLEFGGWTVDDVCIVADANSICGDGKLSGAERCDDGPGNSDTLPDACRDNCRVAGCGDGVLDTSEQCDDGNLNNDDGCNSSCKVESQADCGLSVTGNSRSAPLSGLAILLSMFLVGGLRRRRR